jgi:hypothetical protein
MPIVRKLPTAAAMAIFFRSMVPFSSCVIDLQTSGVARALPGS